MKEGEEEVEGERGEARGKEKGGESLEEGD